MTNHRRRMQTRNRHRHQHWTIPPYRHNAIVRSHKLARRPETVMRHFMALGAAGSVARFAALNRAFESFGNAARRVTPIYLGEVSDELLDAVHGSASKVPGS